MSRPIPRLTRAWLRHRHEIEDTVGAIVLFALIGTLVVLPWLFV